MKMNLSTKIISLFVLGGVIPMVAIGIFSYRSSSKALEQQAFNQLISVRNTKRSILKTGLTRERRILANWQQVI